MRSTRQKKTSTKRRKRITTIMAQKRKRASRRVKSMTRLRAKCNTLLSKKILGKAPESQCTRAV